MQKEKRNRSRSKMFQPEVPAPGVQRGSGKVSPRSGKRSPGSSKCSNVPMPFPARFQRGPSKVSPRFQQGSSRVSTNFPPSFQRVSSKVPAGSSRVPAMLQQGSRNVPVIQRGSTKVPASCQRGSIPPRFQQGSRTVPVFGAWIFASPLPSPRDWNPTDSLLGSFNMLHNTSNVYPLCSQSRFRWRRCVYLWGFCSLRLG